MQVVIAHANDRQLDIRYKKAADFVTGRYSLVQTKIIGLGKIFYTLEQFFMSHSLTFFFFVFFNNALFGPFFQTL